jgi:hypothetical protein
VRSLLAVLLAASSLLAGCDDAPPAETIDRQRFIDTWVELRSEALNARAGTVDETMRAAVLERMGVTEEELVSFAEVHGVDPEFMRGVWNDVSERIEEISFEPTSPPDTAR